jgi:hypothetical protein
MGLGVVGREYLRTLPQLLQPPKARRLGLDPSGLGFREPLLFQLLARLDDRAGFAVVHQLDDSIEHKPGGLR